MFWGLILQSNKRYSQKIQKAFHLTQAALDVNANPDPNVQVWLASENENYLLCTLSKEVKQIALNLIFSEGDEIAFSCVGGTIHLTGYVPEEFDEFGDDAESSDEDAVEEVSPQSKKSKKAKIVEANDDDEDDSDEDESFAENGNGIASSEDDDDEDVDDSDDDDELDEDDDDDDSEEDVEPPPKKVAKLDKKPKQQNGTAELKKPLSKKEKKELKKLENQKKPVADAQQQQQQKKGEQQKKAVEPAQQKSPKDKTLAGGVKIEDIRVGKGAEAKPGKKVQVYYEGRLKTNNKVFDSTKSGEGFKFLLGRGEVIRGWDVGVAGMKVGSKRRITCPPNMAYGAKGSPPVIPPNSTLVFEVELRGVN